MNSYYHYLPRTWNLDEAIKFAVYQLCVTGCLQELEVSSVGTIEPFTKSSGICNLSLVDCNSAYKYLC